MSWIFWIVLNVKEKFEVNFLFPYILDTTTNSVDERFSQLEKVNSALGFRYNVQNLVNETRENIFEGCSKLELELN